ncbi:DUF1592 domain-containing protein [Lysobacter sp. CA196]|uniref:DUF1592 domain-containing protein n=1 Tax=Lysobacter sp. CA196 TaxID=3455606 RepID=UPI003F8D6375
MMKAAKARAWLATMAAVVLMMTACSRDGDAPGGRKSARAGGASACTAPQYVAGTAYQSGQEVSNVGRQFQCWTDEEAPLGPGSWAWCQLQVYNPGLPADSGAVNWPEAWKDLGPCDEGGFEGNRLTVEFAEPETDDSRGAPSGKHPATMSGVLRCGSETVPIRAVWGETLKIDELKRCDYSLVMDVAEGYAPMNAPLMVSFTQEEGEHLSRVVRYRPRVDIAKLRPLPGVKIELFAEGLLQPRQMALGNGVLYVGSGWVGGVFPPPLSKLIYALPLDAGTGKPKGVHVLASGQLEPHGVAYRDGSLFYSTADALYRIPNVDASYDQAKPEQVLKFPGGDTPFPLPPVDVALEWLYWHQKHPLRFNPHDPSDKGLYTAVGIPCNLCMVPADPRYGTILRYDLDSKQATIVARGVRNSLGFDWNPATGDLWFSDNNRQHFPNAEEVNRIANEGEHFGVPYVFGRRSLGFTAEEEKDPRLANDGRWLEGLQLSDIPLGQIEVGRYRPPAFEIASNSAPLGVKFWNGYPQPADAQLLLVATHALGSVDEPGLQLRMLTIKNDQVIHEIPLVDGWLQDRASADLHCIKGGCIGRPVDFLELPDHSLLLSDDVAGAIYRISRYDPSVVPDTELTLRPTAAPSPDIAAERVSGHLIDAAGHKRLFHVAWGSEPMAIKGLAHGDYQVRLNDVGNWIPLKRTNHFTLSAGQSSHAIELGYRERPEHIEVPMTLRAPAKPDGAAGAHWVVKLIDAKDAVREVSVPWGGQTEVVLGYGRHRVIYPYYPTHRPQPSMESVDVNEESEQIELPPMAYVYEGNLGLAVLEDSCSGCHDSKFFDDPNKAHNWDAAGREALVKKIQSMNIEGHCDGVCAGAVSDYLFDTVWSVYLRPQTPFGKRQIRQLTPHEYASSVHDLFDVTINPAKLPADKSAKEFKYPGEADLGILQAEDVKRYYDAALEVAGQVEPQSLGYRKTAEAATFVGELGHKVFRRPMTAPEIERYAALLDQHGLQDMVAGMLLSPHFLYRSELGDDSYGRVNAYKLTPSEVATALSFTFLGTTPSLALLHKAESGGLATPEQIGAEAATMIATERGVEQFVRFIRHYTKTAGDVQEKPGLGGPVIQAMREEQSAFVRHVLLSGESTMTEFFDPRYTFLNQTLALHYGIAGVSGEAMRKVEVDDKRGGLLHQGLTQAATSDYVTTSLVKRGIMIREQLLCREFGAPVEADPETPTFPNRPISTRERWDLVNGEHASSGRCWQCHRFMNDTGASMEHYDAAGRYRLKERAYNHELFPGEVDIDAAGPFVDNVGHGDWAQIQDVRDIAKLIPTNSTALTCMADSYFRYAFGNHSDALTAGTIKQMGDELKSSGSLRKMLHELAISNATLYKKERD